MYFKKILIFLFFLSLVFFPLTGKADLVGNSNNATLELSPQSGIYKSNEAFPVDILVDTHGQDVVVAAAYLNYDPNLFEVTSIDDSDSVFAVQAEEVIDNDAGEVKIVRGSPSPGVNVVDGKVATIYIKGLGNTTPSSDNISFDFVSGATDESNIVLDDTEGTDILSGVYNGEFTVDANTPANISDFNANPGDSHISLSWNNPSQDFAGVKILRKTNNYPSNPTDGTVVYDSDGTNFTDSDLSSGTTYYYTAFSRDVVLNYSDGSQLQASLADSIAPSVISDLSVLSVTSDSVTLNWTAVGDDNNSGTSSGYDLRRSNSAITSTNWSSATQINGEPIPQSSGFVESTTIDDLNEGTQYYFAIRATDEASNKSGISNVPSVKTYKRGDVNSDYLVNSVDFGIMMSYWSDTNLPSADINKDYLVNSVDFGIMMSQWGSY